MISKDLFNQVIDSVEGRFRVTISELDKILWYSYLSESLNDNEFMTAYRMATCTLDFVPSPERLIEFVKGSENTLANQEWQKVVANAPDHVKDALTISARGRKALKLIGGLQAVRDCEVQFLDAKRKSFVELWKEKDSEVESLAEIRSGNLKALPPAKVDYVAMLKEIVVAEQAEAEAKRLKESTQVKGVQK